MTVTEHAPHQTNAAPALEPPTPATGFAGLIGTSDHRTVGQLWIVTSFAFLLVAGISGAVLGVERIDVSGIDFLDADSFAQNYSLHAVAGIFLFLIPLFIGIATAIVPLQIGARSVAFPRASAAAYWTYFVSGLIVCSAYIADGGPFGSEDDAVELFIAAFVALLAALILGAVSIATTGIALRTRGMGLHRTPLFTWSAILTSAMFIITLPVLAGLMVLVYIDHRYGQTFLGGSNDVFARIAWVWGQPSVYVFAVPVLGIVGDVVPVAAQTRITRHRIAMGCVGVLAAFSFGAWAMPGFHPRNSPDLPLAYVGEVPFYAFSALVVLPVLVFIGLMADTLRRGSIRLTSPLIWAIAALVLVLEGTMNGFLVSIDPLDLVGTTAQASQVHFVLLASVFGLYGGLAHWSSKLYGAQVPETPSKVLAAAALVGTMLLCLPDLANGFIGQRWRLGGATKSVDSIEALNALSAAGGLLVVTAAVLFLAVLAKAAFDAESAPDDPWDGHTLEWATTSPPSIGNFDEVPAISSEAPLYDARHAGKDA